jgi:hypothetical protein
MLREAGVQSRRQCCAADCQGRVGQCRQWQCMCTAGHGDALRLCGVNKKMSVCWTLPILSSEDGVGHCVPSEVNAQVCGTDMVTLRPALILPAVQSALRPARHAGWLLLHLVHSYARCNEVGHSRHSSIHPLVYPFTLRAISELRLRLNFDRVWHYSLSSCRRPAIKKSVQTTLGCRRSIRLSPALTDPSSNSRTSSTQVCMLHCFEPAFCGSG